MTEFSPITTKMRLTSSVVTSDVITTDVIKTADVTTSNQSATVRMRTKVVESSKFRPKSMSMLTRSSTPPSDDWATTNRKLFRKQNSGSGGSLNSVVVRKSEKKQEKIVAVAKKIVEIQEVDTKKKVTSSILTSSSSNSGKTWQIRPTSSSSTSSKSSPRSPSAAATPKIEERGRGGITRKQVALHHAMTSSKHEAETERKKKAAMLKPSRSSDNLMQQHRRQVIKQASTESAPAPIVVDSEQHRFYFTLKKSQQSSNAPSDASSKYHDPQKSMSISSTDFSRPADQPADAPLPPPPQLDHDGVDLLNCPILSGRETLIEINKGKSGLGVSIVGGRDSLLNSILVHTVYEEGAAAVDGRLWPGDRLLMVNDHDIREATHDEAIDILWKTVGKVRLLVQRDEHRDTVNNENDEDIYDIHQVKLLKRKGLGLSIIGRRNHPGVYVSDLINGGIAQKEGTMKKGDHILQINGKDVKFASQETVAALLKTAKNEVTITVGRSKTGALPEDITQISHPNLLMQQPEVVIPKEELALLSYTSKEREEHQIRFVEIHKTPAQPIGVSIAGGKNSPLGDVPIFVAMVQQSGPAAKQLHVGDIILSVNGRSTDGHTHEDVVQMLKGSDDSIVLMQVRDGGDEVHKLSEYLKDATSNVNQMISTWDPSIQGLLPNRSTNEPIDIELHRGADGLGISIAGGYGSPHGNIPIFVKSVSKLGAAAEEGRLKKGDQLVSVNGEDLNGYTHEEAAEALRRKTNLIILRVIPS